MTGSGIVIQQKTGRPVQFELLEPAVRYLGVDVEDALTLAEGTEV